MDIKLTLRRTWDDGGAAFETEGIRGTVYIKKAFFKGDAPKTLTISGEGLAEPVSAEAQAAADAKAEADRVAAKADQQKARDEKKAARANKTSAQGEVVTTPAAVNG